MQISLDLKKDLEKIKREKELASLSAVVRVLLKNYNNKKEK